MLGKFSRKEKIGLIVAVFFISGAILDRAVVSPINSKFRQLNQEIKITEKQLSRHLRNLIGKDLIKRKYQKYITYVKKVGSDEEEVAKVLAEIEGLARKSGVSLVDIKPQPLKEVNFYEGCAVEVEANGDMNGMIHFLYQLNSSTQLLRAEKLRLSTKEKGSYLINASIFITKVLIP